jgi:asparagine synthase (glutamine-hydrolysing)
VPPFPGWLEPTLERRLDLRGRWRADNDAILPRPGFQLAHAFWSALFEQLNPGSMQLAAEARYPFMDLRVVRYLLRLPPIPWAVEKNVLRIAMKGVLPRQILCRPKAPLAGNPWAALVPPAHTLWWEPYLLQAPELERFVDVECAKATLATVVRDAQATHHHRDIDILRLSLQPVSLSLWLRHTACAKIRAAD